MENKRFVLLRAYNDNNCIVITQGILNELIIAEITNDSIELKVKYIELWCNSIKFLTNSPNQRKIKSALYGLLAFPTGRKDISEDSCSGFDHFV